jgi:hypothetical protein
MNDLRVWEFEDSLWTGSAEHYRDLIDPECVMVLPEPPYIMVGQTAIQAVSDTPRWSRVVLTDRQVSRPQEGLIVIAYKAEACRGDEKAYEAYCSSTYRRLAQDVWRVVQHHQTPHVAIKA